MTLTVFQLLFGCTVLLVGSWLTVRSVVGAAAWLGASPTVVGMTILPCARITAPMLTAVVAMTMDRPNVALGILFGTATASAAIPTGIACLFMPMKRPNSATRIALFALLCVGVVVLLVVMPGRPGGISQLERSEGVILLTVGLVIAAAFWIAAIRSHRASEPLDAAFAEEAAWPIERPKAWVLFRLLAGFAIIAGGAVDTVSAARALVDHLHLARGVISATAVGALLSLPQVLTVFRNIFLGDPGVFLAQVGSASSFGLFFGVGICAWVGPLTLTHQHTYAISCFACVCIGVGVAAIVRRRLSAAILGALLLVAYAWFACGMFLMPA